MKTTKDYKDFILSIYPNRVTVGDLESWIEVWASEGDEASKKRIADFIYHRLNHRYIQPLLRISPAKYKSGFLMMASACLMIETLQCFHTGDKETPRYKNVEWFKDFFEREQKFFPGFAAGFADKADNFYTNIRCGILHQAETKRGWRILRQKPDEPLMDPIARTLNAGAFLAALERCLDHYVTELRASRPDSDLWGMAVKKLRFICDNCKHEAPNSA